MVRENRQTVTGAATVVPLPLMQRCSYGDSMLWLAGGEIPANSEFPWTLSQG